MKHSRRNIIFILCFFLLSCAADNAKMKTQEASLLPAPASSSKKINGAGMVASSGPLEDEELVKLENLSVNYICLLPFAYVRENEPRVFYNSSRQWWGERPEGIAACIQMAHEHHIKVMVKPQLWLSQGTYTGFMNFETEEDWKTFEESYTAYVFQLLRIADSLHAEMFCIGTELDNFVKERAPYWSSLIDSARKVYHGQLTYAENWDCYNKVPFWNKLDMIGIDAYFPLSDSITPQVNDLVQRWDPHYQQMKSLSEKIDKPVLFTEYGYRSIDCATGKPWESYTDGKCNLAAQKNAYEALYQKFWNEPWFAGGFFWKWFDSGTPTDIPMEKDFSPQDKPAMDVIREWYGKG